MIRVWRFLDSREFAAGTMLGLWLGVGARLALGWRLRRAMRGLGGMAPSRILISPQEETEMLAARAQCALAADELEVHLPHAAAHLRRSLEVTPLSLYVVREETGGGVLERPLATAVSSVAG